MDQPASPPAPHAEHFPSAHDVSPLGGLLSYLVPGLGQIVQGRIAKGLLFFVCVYVLFFYGMYLGAAEVTVREKDKAPRTYRVASNVFLPQPDPSAKADRWALLDVLYNRPQFLGQFWVGVVAWPAIAQYVSFDRAKEGEIEAKADELYDDADREGDEAARAAKLREAAAKERERRHPLFGEVMREPSARAINAVHNASDKRLEVAWVFTVIAGVLNIMVIYDAFAGPAFPAGPDEPKKEA